jgi:soluble lytic murein transglycosylase
MTPGSGLIGRLGARRTLGFIAAGWIAFSFQLPASSFQPHVRETGGRKLETGGRKLEAGGWKLEAGGWKLEAGGRKLEAGGWELGTGSWRLATDTQQLAPTAHPALPHNLEDYWFVPGPRDRAAGRAYGSLTSAAAAYAAGNFGAALTDASAAARVAGPLAQYALYYQGLAELRLSRTADAQRTFDAILEDKPEGHLSTAVLLAKAETADAGGNHATALGMYEKLAAQKTVAPDDVLLRLGRAALSAGDRPKAAEALLRVYYEFPLSDSATTAATLLTDLQGVIRRNGYDLDLGRAKILFGAKRYAEARSAFQDLQRQTGGDDRELTDLRIAECDFFLKRYEAARDALQPYLEKASRRGEARFFYLSALRELGDQDQYLSLAQDLVRAFPTDSWAEETLNNLGSHYILTDQDELAARTFKQLYESFPTGTRAERAAWKYGWWCYRTGNWAETIRVFEGAAAAFPRSDYRPSFLYWSARAHGQLGERTVADARLRLVYTDYMNSYYGRLAARQLAERHAADAQMSSPEQVRPVSAVARAVTPADPPPTAPLITRLLAAGLLDDAANEVRYAQRVWGDSPQLQATAAWIAREKGDRIRGTILMRRAYPQHLAAGGEDLPAEVLQVIYPLTYWDSIRRYATPRGLDPYLMAALINQESKFNPDARSPANAWGLMQIEPSTGRKLARALGIRRFRTSMLTDATTNIRMGMLYFSDLVGQFGGTYYALASYNAGETRVVRWRAERPKLDEDEFIDDIPFPETQNYVKRILGTAEDYRRLYGSGEGRAQTTPAVNRTAAQSTVSHASSKPSSSSKSHTTAKKKKKAPPKKAPSKKKSAPR